MLTIGTVIHQRYRVVKQIGIGGMGAVYRASDLRLKRDVALKYMLINHVPAYVRAFAREAQLLAHLRHAALPDVSDYFIDNDRHFLVMEFVDGTDLAQLLQQRTVFDLATVVQWGDVLLNALGYLHGQSSPVIHRDIKPQNVKLRPDGTVVLLDFGLAKGAVDPLLPDSSGNSVYGYTLQYSAMEQIQGLGTDQRSDLYALGATLYHLMTGVPPPNAPTRTMSTASGLGDPLMPAHHYNPLVPIELSAVIARALALRPDARYESASTMRAALNAAWESRSWTMLERAGANDPRAAARTAPHTVALHHADPREVPISVAAPAPSQAGLPVGIVLLIAGACLAGLLFGLASTLPSLRPQQQQILVAACMLSYSALVVLLTLLTPSAPMTRDARTLGQHRDIVLSVAFSPDGRLLASASRDATIRVWHVGAARLLYTCTGHQGAIRRVCFAPDGRTLISAGDDATVRLWRVADGTPLGVLRGHTGSVGQMAVSPDGQVMASAGDDAIVQLWRLADGALLHTLRGHIARVWNIAFARDGGLLASAGDDTSVRLWSVVTGELIQELVGHTDYVCDIQFSPDGQTLASSSRDATVRLWCMRDGALLQTMRGHTLMTGGVMFHPGGQLLASRSEDTTIQLWRVRDGAPIRTLKGHSRYVSGLVFAPDGKTLASVSWDASVHIWRVDDGHLLRRLRGHTARIWDVTYSADGRWLATAGMDFTVRLWSVHRM